MSIKKPVGGLGGHHGTIPINDVEKRVRDVLGDRLDDEGGHMFVKTHQIVDTVNDADGIDASTTRVGHALGRLADTDAGIEVSRWSGESTTPIVWEVAR